MDRLIYGADTETVHGLPNTMQFYSEDTVCEKIFFVNKSTACSTFLKWCGSLRKRCEHIVYVHFLSFDLPEFFYGHQVKLARGEFDFEVDGWRITGVHGTPTFVRLRKHEHTSITLIDSYSFFKMSLARGAQMVCPDLPKLKRPETLGVERITARDAAGVAYAMRDAEVAYHIGKKVDELHQEFQVRQCVSLAQLAERIFRHRFLTYSIPQPQSDVVHAALCAYHGGKNGIYAEQGWHLDVTSIDISSAYPEAMSDMPAFGNYELYRDYRVTRGGASAVKQVPRYGVYCVRGTTTDDKYPVIFDHGFKAIRGKVSDTWVQGFDLNEALRSGEIKLQGLKGMYYDCERDHGAPALRAYCEDFYRRKQSEKDDVKRYSYKSLLNSLYGKFIQTRKKAMVEYLDIDGDKLSTAGELAAGGMFHPFIASAISAAPRARIHRLEHKWNAIHTATDAVMTHVHVLKKHGSKYHDLYPTDGGIGALEVEAQGDLLLVRNKCYIIYANAHTSKKLCDKGLKSRSFRGKIIVKYAMHGFQGSVFDLERLIATGRRSYTYWHANKLKESVRRGLQVNDFVERMAVLKVGPIVLAR
jgi:hypothetical protein